MHSIICYLLVKRLLARGRRRHQGRDRDTCGAAPLARRNRGASRSVHLGLTVALDPSVRRIMDARCPKGPGYASGLRPWVRTFGLRRPLPGGSRATSEATSDGLRPIGSHVLASARSADAPIPTGDSMGRATPRMHAAHTIAPGAPGQIGEPSHRRGYERFATLPAALALIVVVFLASVAMREPWRGHLARGDQWVTAQTLRYTRAWHRDGPIARKLDLPMAPPTDEFFGGRRARKWGPFGHVLIVYAVLETLRVEPDVRSVMSVNLGLQLVIVLLLTGVAHWLARITWPERRPLAALVAAHCGVFCVLFPPMLYWGQSLACQDFAMLPPFIVVVAARWMRGFVESPRARLAVDLAIVAGVILGVVTDFLFWVLIPYLVATRRSAERAGRPHTTERWGWTLAVPWVVTMIALFTLFVFQGHIFTWAGRVFSWTTGSGEGNKLQVAVGHVFLLVKFFLSGHFSDALAFPGLLALALAAIALRVPGRVAGLPAEARGLLVDLLMPCLIVALLLAPHQAAHTFAPMKYVPFVALTWTFLVPLVLQQRRSPRTKWLWRAYAVVAVLAVLPSSSGWRRFFPPPVLEWETQAAFLKENVERWRRVYSATTEIDILPPQPIALSERAVTHAYGLLDLSLGALDVPPAPPPFRVEQPNPLGPIALYGPRAYHVAFGAVPADVVERDGYILARYPLNQVLAILDARPDATFRRHLLDVLAGDLERAERTQPLRRLEGQVPRLSGRIAMHALYPDKGKLRDNRLYVADDQHWHYRTAERDFVTLGDEHFTKVWSGVWKRLPTKEEAPIEWGRFVRGLFDRVAEQAKAGEAIAFAWQGHEVARAAVPVVPAVLRAAFPRASGWRGYVLFKGATPVGAALAANVPGGADAVWVAVVFDELAAEIGVPGEIHEEWTVKHPSQRRAPRM